MKQWPALLLALMWLGCTRDDDTRIATLPVVRGEFEISVVAEGILKAVKSTPINAPTNMHGSNTLVWMAEKGTRVATGDVIVRFDEQTVLIQEQDTRGDLTTLEYRASISDRTNLKQGNQLDTDLFLVDEERRQAELFAPKDDKLYSRHEIIDAEVNIDFLNTKKDHYVAKKGRHEESSETDRQIHQLKKKGYQIKLDQIAAQKKTLAITAPHDGELYYVSNWRGEEPTIGQTVWRGMPLAELPDLSQMKAVVQVLETLAGGIKPGLPARVELDSRPGHPYEAEVATVAALAKPIETGSPVKYFEVTLTLKKTDTAYMRPNSSISAVIYIEKQTDVISIPSQLLFSDEEGHYVYVREGEGFARRSVSLGKRSPTRTVIMEGLEPDELIAMSEPEEVVEP